MQGDPTLAAQLQPFRGVDIGASFQRAESLRDIAQQRGLRRMQMLKAGADIQESAVDVRTKRAALEQVALLHELLKRSVKTDAKGQPLLDEDGEPQFDPEKAIPMLLRGGFPEKAEQLRTNWSNFETAQLARKKLLYETNQNDLKEFKKQINSVIQSGNQAKFGEVWPQLIKYKLVEPEGRMPLFAEKKAVLEKIVEDNGPLDDLLTDEIAKSQRAEARHKEKKAALELEKAESEKTAGKKIDEYINNQNQRVIVFQRQDGSTYNEIQGTVGPTPRAPVPGTDFPLSQDVEEQRKRIAAANHVDPEQVIQYSENGVAKIGIVNKRTKHIEPITDGTDSSIVNAPLTADQRNKQSGRELVKTSITAIQNLSDQIITMIGPAQRMDAIKRGAEAVFGTDPKFRSYQDSRTALAGNLAVAQQGSRPSDADIKAIWLPLIPDPYRDTKESAEIKWNLIKTLSNTDSGSTAHNERKVKLSDGTIAVYGADGKLLRTEK